MPRPSPSALDAPSDSRLRRMAVAIRSDGDVAAASDRAAWILPRLDRRQTRLFLELLGAQIGDRCCIEPMLRVHNNNPGFARLRVGDGCHLGKEVFLDLRDDIVIADQVTISMRTTIITHLSMGDIPLSSRFPRRSGPVRIERDVYIGAGATILHGVTIGSHSVVAAGAMVARDVEPNTVVGGVPARLIKRLDAIPEIGS